VLFAGWMSEPGRGDDLEGAVTQDNLCGADGLRATDPVANARPIALRDATYRLRVILRDSNYTVEDSETRLAEYEAAVRTAALEEAARLAEVWAEPAVHPNQNVTACAGPTNQQRAIAAAIRRLAGEGT
jgi:hypothetical protein